MRRPYFFSHLPRISPSSGALTAFFAAAFLAACSRTNPDRPEWRGAHAAPPVITGDLARNSAFPPGAAVACGVCHAEQFQAWLPSQHANANRLVSPALDAAAFHPAQTVTGASFHARFHQDRDRFLATLTGTNALPVSHRAEAVIGVTPLRQYLVPAPGGRLQALDPAFDPRTNEWFQSQPPPERVPGDWGHWTGRGMNWNSSCAFCHMTGFDKGYDIAADTYRSTWQAMGISCAQCHGPMPGHTAKPKDPVPESEKLSSLQKDHNCASCHARREELTGRFQPGAAFDDHYRLTLLERPGVFHPDGQVLDEDFEYGSFMLSRMGHKNVSCLECHDPHSGRLKLPAENNALCLSCHAPPGRLNATLIPDPSAHSGHKPGSTGNRCVECHMPANTYMARDDRRDHGFTSPDPVLTKELGVPNACNRCHTDQSIDWAIEWTANWYGPKMDRRSRHRARAIARAWNGDDTAAPVLAELARTEEIGAWHATLIQLLAPWAGRPAVRPVMDSALTHTNALVRAAAAAALAPLPGIANTVEPLLRDPSRLVRLEAAWALWREPAVPESVRAEFRAYAANMSDQPYGALRQAQIALVEERHADAARWARTATVRDPSPGAHALLGRVLHAGGSLNEAIASMRKAVELEPANADNNYALALLLAEAGRNSEALAALRATVKNNPGFGRAWYNLGLALNSARASAEALHALEEAARLLPDSGDPAYAAATIHAQAGNRAAARDACLRALRADPAHQPARDLLNALTGR